MIMVWQGEKLRDYLTSLHVATDSEELFVLVLGDNLLRHYFIFFLLLEISFYLYFRFSGPKRSWRCHPKGLLLRKIRNNLRKLPTMDINFISAASNCTQTQLFIKMTRCEGAGVLKQKRKTTQPYVRWTPNFCYSWWNNKTWENSNHLWGIIYFPILLFLMKKWKVKNSNHLWCELQFSFLVFLTGTCFEASTLKVEFSWWAF